MSSNQMSVTFTAEEMAAMKAKAKEIGMAEDLFIKNVARARLGLPIPDGGDDVDQG